MKNHTSKDIGLEEFYYHFFRIGVPELETFVLIGQVGQDTGPNKSQWKERNQKVKIFADHLADFINVCIDELES